MSVLKSGMDSLPIITVKGIFSPGNFQWNLTSRKTLTFQEMKIAAQLKMNSQLCRTKMSSKQHELMHRGLKKKLMSLKSCKMKTSKHWDNRLQIKLLYLQLKLLLNLEELKICKLTHDIPRLRQDFSPRCTRRRSASVSTLVKPLKDLLEPTWRLIPCTCHLMLKLQAASTNWMINIIHRFCSLVNYTISSLKKHSRVRDKLIKWSSERVTLTLNRSGALTWGQLMHWSKKKPLMTMHKH